MAFVAIIILMVLAAMACVALPLVVRRQGPAGMDMTDLKAHNKALAALERRLGQGELDMPGYLTAREQLEKEFQVRLAQQPQPAAPAAVFKPSLMAAGTVAVILPVFAVGMYAAVGNWRVATQGVAAESTDTVNQMVAHLAERLNTTDANDADGWQMLGRSYVVMGRYADAKSAYSRAYALLGDKNPALMTDYAEAIILADPGGGGNEAAPLLDKALRATPDDSKTLWYVGLLALRQGHKDLAIQRWQQILAQNPSPDIRQMVEQHVRDAGGVPGPARAVTQTAGTPFIPVHVSLAANLTGKVPPGAMLFVFVRPTDGAGGPPLLATRMRVDTLPVDLKLSGADAMLPGTSLANYTQVNVVARLSMNGNAIAQPGDMEGDTVFRFTHGNKVAAITIDRVIR